MFLSTQFLQGLFSSHFALSCRQLSQALKDETKHHVHQMRGVGSAEDVPVMLAGIFFSRRPRSKLWGRDHLVPLVGHTSVSVHTGWEADQDETAVSAAEGGRWDADIAAAPGRCRNSCASSPPCGRGEDGHAGVGAEAGRDRFPWSWASRFEVV